MSITTLDRTQPPVTYPLKFQPFTEPVIVQNGTLEATLVHSTYEPALTIHLVLHTGNSSHSPGIATLCSKLMNEGTRSLPGSEFAEALALLGAFVGIAVSKDHTTISINCLRAQAKPVLELIRQMMLEPELKEQDYNRLLRQTQQQILVGEQKNATWAGYVTNELLYPDHAYGRVLSSQSINELTYAQIQDWYKTVFLTAKLEAFIAGYEPAEIASMLFDVLDNWQGNVVHEHKSWEFPVANHGVRKHLVGPSVLQTTVKVIGPAISYDHDDWVAYRTGIMVFAGYFGSRLMSNIREEKGYTYGIGGGVVTNLKSRYLSISTDVKAEAAQDTVHQIFLELERLQTEELPEQELETVKSYLLGTYLGSINTAAEVLDRVKALKLEHRPFERVRLFYESMQDLTTDQVQQAMQRHLLANELAVVTVGPDIQAN